MHLVDEAERARFIEDWLSEWNVGVMEPEEEGHCLVNGSFRLCSPMSSCDTCLQEVFDRPEAGAGGHGDERLVIVCIKIAESWAGDRVDDAVLKACWFR